MIIFFIEKAEFHKLLILCFGIMKPGLCPDWMEWGY